MTRETSRARLSSVRVRSQWFVSLLTLSPAYLAPQSVTNALIFDGAIFNRDDPKAPTGVLTITEADFSYKANKDGATDRKPQDGGGKPKKKITKAQIKAKTEEMNRLVSNASY